MTDAAILVVDDDPKIRTLLRNVLEDEGFSVSEADCAACTMSKFENGAFDLVTLDIHLGSDSGLEVARDIRKTSNVPIVMVTGKDDVIDRVVGLELGADDYITKPFHVREVVARVRSVLRRTSQPTDIQKSFDTLGANTCFHFDDMTACPQTLVVLDRDGQANPLTSGDFKLLQVFLERPKRALSRDQLMDLIGGLEWSPLDRTIDNQVARLRKKIEREPSKPSLIKTVRGVGYMFACDVTKAQVSPVPASNA